MDIFEKFRAKWDDPEFVESLNRLDPEPIRIVGINCLWSGNPAVQASEQLLICIPYVNFGVKNCPIDRMGDILTRN
jgi:hypothetical protein